MARPRNFKSRQAYLDWLAYGHGTGVFEKTKGNQRVTVRGKPVKVKHLPKRGTR